MRDPYSILGVKKTATGAEIKKAFRRLAKTHHPDRNTSDPKAKDRFAEANSAYEIVGDAKKRAQFDAGEIDAEGKPRFQGFEGFARGGGARREQGFASGGPFSRGAGAGAGATDDIFSHLFGEAFRGAERAGRPRPSRGEDVAVAMTVTIEDIVGDAKSRIAFPNGREVEVTIPRGVAEGQVVRLRGLGQPGSGGGEPGDALLTLHIAPHPVFTVEGADLRMRQPIEIEDAVLGGTVRVHTPTGPVDMTIPEMCNSGRTLRLRGKGLPGKSGVGDLLVTLEIRLPERADEDLRDYARRRREARVS